MSVKTILRKMRIPRILYYKWQLKKQLSQLPREEMQNNMQALAALKGRYAGKRCFVIGNGPSLTTDDLDKLKNEISFASTRIYTLYNKTEWRPTFYAIQDDLVLKDALPFLRDVAKTSANGFVSINNYGSCKETVKELENLLWMPLRYCPPKHNQYAFSDAIEQEVFEGLTITYSCLQLAAYMGFSEIYLLGTDHNYPVELDSNGNVIKRDDTVQAYFADAKVPMSAVNLPKVVEMTRAFISAEKHSRENGYRIFNATRGGKLEVFERVSFDELTL